MRRVLDWPLRRLVRWLRRHRYARMAGRTRALEIELGMIEPDHATRSVAEIREILTQPALLAEAFATCESTEKLIADYRRSFFANSEPMAELIELYKTLIDLRPELPSTGSHALDGWTRCGFDAEQAATWYQAGFTPWHARDYRDQYGTLSCIPVAERVRWARHAIDIAERHERLTHRSSA